MGSHEEDLLAFFQRKFSGRDLVSIMDYLGYGVGSTMHTVRAIEIEQNRPNSTYRKWDYPMGEVNN